MVRFENWSRRATIVAALIAALVFFGLLLLALWTWPKRVEASQIQSPGFSPFDQQVSRFVSQIKQVSGYRTEKGDFVTPQNRGAIVDRIVAAASFLKRNSDGVQTVDLGSYRVAEVDFRNLVDAVLQPGDLTFNVSWVIGGKSIKTVGVADSKGNGKFEPLLYTSAYRAVSEDTPLAGSAHGGPLKLLRALSRFATDSIQVVNAAEPPPLVRVTI